MFRGRMERLGWIRAPRVSLAQWGPLVAFADAARRDGLTRVLVCGMGGSSLTAEVVARACGATSLQVLDSTDPAAVLDAERAAPRDRTLFLVVSKSGTTLETLAFYRYFAARARPEQFVAVTDPGTPLEALAREQRLRAVFPHPPDVGGRYAALTVVGMLPAALIGVDGRVLLERALAVDVARAKAWGVALARAALAGRDKLVLRPPARVAAIAAWGEQLVAERSRETGRGRGALVGGPARHRDDAGLRPALPALHGPTPQGRSQHGPVSRADRRRRRRSGDPRDGRHLRPTEARAGDRRHPRAAREGTTRGPRAPHAARGRERAGGVSGPSRSPRARET